MKTAMGDGGVPGLSNEERQKPRGQIGHAENAHLLEEQYEQWRVNPSSVDATWRAFFEGFELGTQLEPDREGLNGSSEGNGIAAPVIPAAEPTVALPAVDPMRQGRLSHLLFAYRMLGHYIANIDPLGFNKKELPELDLHNFKFTDADLDQEFNAGTAGGVARKRCAKSCKFCRTPTAAQLVRSTCTSRISRFDAGCVTGWSRRSIGRIIQAKKNGASSRA